MCRSCIKDEHYHCPECGKHITQTPRFEAHLRTCSGSRSSVKRLQQTQAISDAQRSKHVQIVKAFVKDNYVTIVLHSNNLLLALAYSDKNGCKY